MVDMSPKNLSGDLIKFSLPVPEEIIIELSTQG